MGEEGLVVEHVATGVAAVFYVIGAIAGYVLGRLSNNKRIVTLLNHLVNLVQENHRLHELLDKADEKLLEEGE